MFDYPSIGNCMICIDIRLDCAVLLMANCLQPGSSNAALREMDDFDFLGDFTGKPQILREAQKNAVDGNSKSMMHGARIARSFGRREICIQTFCSWHDVSAIGCVLPTGSKNAFLCE
jgi:hypothetical protein